MIEMTDVTKKYRNRVVLNHINMTLPEGCYGLLGPNGAGKTTLIQAMLGVHEVNEGNISLSQGTIGYLPQQLELWGDARVEEMLGYFASMKNIDKTKREKEVERVLKQVNLYERKKEIIKKLSGGMKQRVGIAQALLGDPDLLVLDEPTVGLDPEERNRFKYLIASIKENRTIIISSHIVSDIECLCDHVIIMNKGKVLEQGPLKYESLESHYLEKIKEESI